MYAQFCILLICWRSTIFCHPLTLCCVMRVQNANLWQAISGIRWNNVEHFRSDLYSAFSGSQVINSKQLTQESLRMVTARVLVVLSGSFTSQIETGPTLTWFSDSRGIHSPQWWEPDFYITTAGTGDRTRAAFIIMLIILLFISVQLISSAQDCGSPRSLN